MGMPEPGGSVHVGLSRAAILAAICLFADFWLLLWAALDYLFGNELLGHGAGNLIFGSGLVLTTLISLGAIVLPLLASSVRLAARGDRA
jgi:uncharacterized membrane protein YozB (DUF420 family)